MGTLAFALVVCSGLMNAAWNLFTKRSLNKTVFLWSIHVVATVLYLPFFIYEMATNDISAAGYGLMALSMLFQGLYFLMLAKAYTVGDLSQVYPLVRGTGALLVPILSVLFLEEHLSWMAWCGVFVLVCGITVLSQWKSMLGMTSAVTRQTILYALAVGLCITGYTLVDKLTLNHISPLALIEVSHFGYMLTLTAIAVKSRQIREEWRVNWRTIALGVIMAPGSYLLFLFAMDLGQVAQLAPIREVSIVFGALFGVVLLGERPIARRLVASVIIVIGIVLIKG